MDKEPSVKFERKSTTVVNGLISLMFNKGKFDSTVEAYRFMSDCIIDYKFEVKPRQTEGECYYLNEYHKELHEVWRAIGLMYDSGHLPLSVDYKLELERGLDALYPEMLERPRIITSLAEAISQVDTNMLGTSFQEFKDYNLTGARVIAAHSRKIDESLNKSNKSEAVHEARKDRMKRADQLYASHQDRVFDGGSKRGLDALYRTAAIERVHFQSVFEAGSIDDKLGGFPAMGLVGFLARTGGGKTLTMSSLIANQFIRAGDANLPAPVVFGYIGEDSEEVYLKRVISNIYNKKEKEQLGCEELFVKASKDEKLREKIAAIHAKYIPEGHFLFIDGPGETDLSKDYNYTNLVNTLNKMALTKKPSFVVIDYLQTLKSPASKSSTREQDLTSIAAVLDQWGQKNTCPVITAMQPSPAATDKVEALEFLTQADIYESKSVMSACRLFISLMDIEYIDEKGRVVSEMAMKVIKNRSGERGQIFLSPNKKAQNIVLETSKHLTFSNWSEYKARVLMLTAGNKINKGVTNGHKVGGFKPRPTPTTQVQTDLVTSEPEGEV